jgi:alpha-tubulin suppressor-like RCC1 family protein
MSGTIQGLPPANTSLPVISGSAGQGQTLTATNGSWDNSPASYTYQWARCDSEGENCTNILSATDNSYVIVVGDVGFTINVTVTATNPYGSTAESSTQTLVVTAVEEIGAGGFRSCALINNGQVKCWGYNNEGQIGDGTHYNLRLTPVSVLGIGGTGVLTNVTHISVGDTQACALISGGTVDCWGKNDVGQLGNGTRNQTLTPTQVVGVLGDTGPLTGIIQISAGENHVCAVKQGGTIYCWGADDYGQLGNSASGTGTYSSYPVLVSGITNATQVSSGFLHACALLSDQSVKCWGYNGFGELGTGGRSNTSYPATVLGVGGSGTLVNVTKISATNLNTCAVISGGSLDCWGIGNNGEIGNGGVNDSLTPAQVSGVGGEGTLSNVVGVTMGASHVCALIQGGNVDCWGMNGSYGMLGNDSSVASLTPVQVVGVGGTGVLANVTQISASISWHTCALISTGSVDCWGSNDYGNLGTGDTTSSSTPVGVIGLP